MEIPTTALEKHHASLQRVHAAIARFRGLPDEIADVLRLKLRADRAAEANLRAVLAGEDTSETQAELDDALDEALAYEDGFWIAVIWYLFAPSIEGTPNDPQQIH